MRIIFSQFNKRELDEMQVSVDKQREVGIGLGDVSVSFVPENLQKLIAWREESRKAVVKYGESLLREAFSDFFDQCPEVYAIVWVQYTPYYNEYSNSITFSVHQPEVLPYPDQVESEIIERIVEDDAQWTGSWPEPEDLDWHYGDWSMLTYDKPTACQKHVQSIWDETIKTAFSDDAEVIMNMMFGEGRVVATRGGFNTYEYDHD